MKLIHILREDTGNDATRVYDDVPESVLEKNEGIVDNAKEFTIFREYYLRGKLVQRSAHVCLKTWLDTLRGSIGNFGAPAFVPTPGWGGLTRVGDFHSRLRASPDGLMWANSQAMTNAFKRDVLDGLHAFGASVVRGSTTKDTFNIALYLVSASRGAGDTVYNTTGELAASGNYAQGGVAVTNASDPSIDTTTGIWTPSGSCAFPANMTSSGAFDCGLLYNATSASKLAVAVFTFGSQSITSGTFTLTMPSNVAATALIRIA